MKKYIKPEIEIISFQIESDVMVNPTTAPMATVGATQIMSVGNAYIDSNLDNKAWTSVDGTNWNWVD